MGGMYTNMIGAVEPRYGALVPTGAGGFWNLMILDTAIIPGARGLLAAVLGVDDEHARVRASRARAMALGWEIAEPTRRTWRASRVVRSPGLPARHVYEPIGVDDEYFPTPIFDAAALAYGNQQAGTVVWPVDAGGARARRPRRPRRVSGEGQPRTATTRVVVQYRTTASSTRTTSTASSTR